MRDFKQAAQETIKKIFKEKWIPFGNTSDQLEILDKAINDESKTEHELYQAVQTAYDSVFDEWRFKWIDDHASSTTVTELALLLKEFGHLIVFVEISDNEEKGYSSPRP